MTDILACRLYDDLTPAQAAATGSVVRACGRCHARVWVVPRNLRLAAAVMCRPCAAAVNAAALARGEVVLVLPARPAADAAAGDAGHDGL